eukprot:SAG31_NODE_7536_length_1660_cov_10.227418_2_plen_183_part_00
MGDSAGKVPQNENVTLLTSSASARPAAPGPAPRLARPSAAFSVEFDASSSGRAPKRRGATASRDAAAMESGYQPSLRVRSAPRARVHRHSGRRRMLVGRGGRRSRSACWPHLVGCRQPTAPPPRCHRGRRQIVGPRGWRSGWLRPYRTWLGPLGTIVSKRQGGLIIILRSTGQQLVRMRSFV